MSIEADIWAVYARTANEEALWFPASAAVDPRALSWMESAIGEIAGEFDKDGDAPTSADRRPIEIEAPSHVTPLHIRSRLAIPFNISGTFAGVLLAGSHRIDHFGSNHLHILSTLAMEMELAIENILLHREALQSERLAAIGETVAGMAHSTINVVSAITSAVHVIDTGLERNDWSRAERAWEVIKRDLESISRLVMNMLDYSKKREPILEVADLSEIVGDVVAEFAERAESRGVVLSVDLPQLPVASQVDEDRMKDCLRNLVSNGIDAMPSGGPMRVEVEESRGRIADGPVQDILAVHVRDAGVGITDEEMKNLFVPFYSTKGTKGTGIGLAVSRKIVEEHGGEIKVDSKPGDGTTFTVRLPRRTDAQGDKQERKEEHE